MDYCVASLENNAIDKKKEVPMKKISLLCVLMFSCNAWGNVYSALQSVYDTNPIINAQRSNLDKAAADVRATVSEFQPYLGLLGNVGAARTKIAGETFDYSPLQYGAEFQQNIFQGGANFAQYKSAKGLFYAQQARLYATQQDVFMSAINAYIEVLNAKQVLELNENNHRVLTEYYNFVCDGMRVGRLTKTDVAQASARLEMAQFHVVDARAKYENSMETIQRIYGNTDIVFSDIDLGRVKKLFPESIQVAEDNALKNHPMLIALNEQENAISQNIISSYKSILPSVDVRGSFQQIDDVPYLDKIRDGRIGVYLKIPLYDKGYAFASADKVRASVSGIQDDIINARRTIVENLHMAWNIYESQEYAINATLASVNANKTALAGIRDEQQRGRRTVLDVLNAEQELLNSRVAHIQAEHARISAYFAVLASVGRLTPENLGLEISEK